MINEKKVLGVTLARGGSKSIKKKNLVDLNGYPLIYYTIKEAAQSKFLDAYIVSTDDDEIASVAQSFGARVPFIRPPDLAKDNSTSASALIHAVNALAKLGEEYDYVVELMATNPLKNKEDIDSCIDLCASNQYDCVVAVHKLEDHHPSRIKYIENGKLHNFYPEIPESRRQDLTPDAYIRSGSIYVTSVEFLLKHEARYSATDTYAYILDQQHVVNIDTPDDLELARVKLLKL